MRRLFIATLVLLVISTLADNAHAEEIKTANQAIQRALKFFQDVGWEVPQTDDGPQAKFPSRLNQRAWQVDIGDIEADVDAKTGAIHGASRYRGGRKPQNELGISASQALTLMKTYLKAAGITLVEFEVTTNEYEQDADQWTVCLRSTYKGYPFYGTFMRMHLLPKDGKLLRFSCGYDPEVPLIPRNKLDKDHAVGKAREYMAKMVAPLGNLQDAELVIVYPTYKWEYREAGVILPIGKVSRPRLAWIMRFDAPYADTRVWVDAENGEVIGGAESLSRAKGQEHVRLPFPAMPDMESIDLGPSSDTAQARSFSAKSKDGSLLSDMIRQLKFFPGKEGIELPVRLKLHGGGRSYIFGFSAEAHRLILIKKTFKDKTIDGNVSWETTKEFEDLIAKYVPPTKP